VFVCFFDAEAKLGCHSEMQSGKCKQDENHRRKLTAKFARTKKSVKLRLVNVGSHPGNKSSDPRQKFSNMAGKPAEAWQTSREQRVPSRSRMTNSTCPMH